MPRLSDQTIIDRALQILESRIGYDVKTDQLTNPDATRDYLRLKLEEKLNEVFAVVFLNNKHEVIEYREMFFGSIANAAVYPREIVRAAIDTNAAAVILAHNHPSGDPDPSNGDIQITERVKQALGYIDVRTLDHIVIGHGKSVSLAERGQI